MGLRGVRLNNIDWAESPEEAREIGRRQWNADCVLRDYPPATAARPVWQITEIIGRIQTANELAGWLPR